MKKSIIGAVALGATFSFLAFGKPASAACGTVFYVGDEAEVVSGCSGLATGQEIEGFSIDVENNKITLDNYNGGAIHYICRATCASVKSMEIELIGENTITSESSDTYLEEGSMPQDAAFINIVPSFTGEGTLKIKAGQPFAFEDNRNSDEFSIDVIGSDFEKTTIATSDDDEDEEPVTSVVETETETTGSTKKVTTTEPFFETALGAAILVAVPSVLVIVIAILVVALIKKGGNKAAPAAPVASAETNNNPSNNQ